MGLPAFSCELHARVTLATDLQAMKDKKLAVVGVGGLARTYGLSAEVVEHIRDAELRWRAR